MTAYVALLRGIAPTNPKMRNAELVKVFEGVGLEDVTTVISSGNVLFSSDDRSATRLEARIEEALQVHLGAPCSTIIRSRAQIEKVLGLDVFDGRDDAKDARLNVTFLKRPPKIDPPQVGAGAEILDVREKAVFSVVDTTTSGTPDLMLKLEKAYGKEITTRTWKTVRRIDAAFAKTFDA